MIPVWLHFLSLTFLLLGALCLVGIAVDVVRSPQHMGIMNVVWLPVLLLRWAAMGLDRPLNLIRLSLFWHFLDLVWIGIFSVVYLQGGLG